jgi:translation initiation factor 2 subunit 3
LGFIFIKYKNNEFIAIGGNIEKAADIKKFQTPEVNIGLVGHVDHGKTTLTQALSGKWTDTHSEELKRGISIKLGYADVTFYKCTKCSEPECYSTTPKCIKCFSDCKPLRTVSLVDAPGHETLMATVLSGAALMDGALLLISADEPCPQPQTSEHLAALEIVGIKNIIIVQNKIDVVTPEKVMENYQQIKEFVKGSIAENAPVIPVSAQQRINIDALIKIIEETIPTPKRDLKKSPKMLIARSFDVNKPGTEIKKLKGGVIGGSLLQGVLKIGDEIEIRPGIKIKDSYEPVFTKITGAQKAGKNVNEIEPGGLAGISTTLDPYLTKSDGLSGNVLGLVGKLPPIISEIKLKTKILERVVGSKDNIKMEEIRPGSMLLLTVSTNRTIGVVTSKKGNILDARLKIPICAEKSDRVAISQQFSGRWRLMGYGEII